MELDLHSLLNFGLPVALQTGALAKWLLGLKFALEELRRDIKEIVTVLNEHEKTLTPLRRDVDRLNFIVGKEHEK